MTKINNPSYTFKDALTAAGITIDKDPEGNDDNGYTVTISGLEYKVKGLKDSTTASIRQATVESRFTSSSVPHTSQRALQQSPSPKASCRTHRQQGRLRHWLHVL